MFEFEQKEKAAKIEKLKQAEEVEGYARLCEEDKAIFQAFLRNFYSCWESPEKWIPEKVARKKDKCNGVYLRVDFEDEFEGDRWLHVKNETTWY